MEQSSWFQRLRLRIVFLFLPCGGRRARVCLSFIFFVCFYYSSRVSNNGTVVRNILNDCRAGPDCTPFSNFNALNYGGANANMFAFAYRNISCKFCVRRNMNKDFKYTILINGTIGIKYDMSAYLGI